MNSSPVEGISIPSTTAINEQSETHGQSHQERGGFLSDGQIDFPKLYTPIDGAQVTLSHGTIASIRFLP
jgi:hypothetical protein